MGFIFVHFFVPFYCSGLWALPITSVSASPSPPECKYNIDRCMLVVVFCLNS